MRVRFKNVIIPTLLACILSNCSSHSEPMPAQANSNDLKKALNPELIASDKTFLKDSKVTTENLKNFAQINNAFAFSLYAKLNQGDKVNIVLSPFSVQSAFALLYPGSSPTAEAEISKALQFTLPQTKFQDNMNAQMLSYSAMASKIGSKSSDEPKIELNIANDVWVKKGKKLQTDYLDTIKTFYNAGVRPLDFESDPEGSRKIINAYISATTKDKIKDLLPPNSIQPSTAMVLSNAIYLYADWAVPFEKENTQKADFKIEGGSTKKVQMMHGTRYSAYAETESYQAVSLPYTGDKLAMMIILPKKVGGLAAVEKSLDASSWTKLLASTKDEEVDLSLPKFDFKWGTQSLKETLKELGLKAVFSTENNNFPKLLEADKPDEKYFISDVLHQATVTIDEKGTIAAAATAIVGGDGASASPGETIPPKVVRVDHPATFVIYDTKSSGILFLGHIANFE
ncbi:MAG: serpin family protein [Proteobacteria bacterium]|nr:MAG: serpin family protein [Pseudomonadota bacterium]